MYKISDFAEISGLSKETFRYYVEIKLIESKSDGIKRLEGFLGTVCG